MTLIVFQAVDTDILKQIKEIQDSQETKGKVDKGMGGSTALLLVFPDKESFYVINLGDSNIALYKEGKTIKKLNSIHNLTVESER